MTVTASAPVNTLTPGRLSEPARRPVSSRFTLGRVLPPLLAVLTVAAFLVVLRERAVTVLVPVAAHTIPAGSPVDAGAVTLVKLPASSALRSGLLDSATVASGHMVATSSIAAGVPITKSEVQASSATAAHGSMSLTVSVDHADGGNLVDGDTVNVAMATGGQVTYVATGLTVLGTASKGGSLTSGSGTYYVVVAVDSAQGLSLTQALAATAGSSGSLLEIIKTPPSS